MNTLRNRLEELDKGLYGAYLNSYEMAMKQWLPYIEPHVGSYNSYPHVCNMEFYLDEIFFNTVKRDAGDMIELSAAEIYLLLNAVLFHDIGKAYVKSFKKTNPGKHFDHAAKSEEVILQKWSQLGIVSEEMAFHLADICLFHDEGGDQFDDINKKLHTVYIDKYGEIRVRSVAALLLLADHLDTTYSRTPPDFIGDKGQIGEFRKKIKGVRINFCSKMVCTALDSAAFKTDVLQWIRPVRVDKPKKATGSVINRRLSKMQMKRKLVKERDALGGILGDTYRNNEALEKIQNDLFSMGIPLNAWFIECDGHLYKVGRAKENKVYTISETIEPIFDTDFIKEILDGMKRLSISILCPPYHTYRELMNHTRDNDMYKVRCAASRISLCAKDIGDSIGIFCENFTWHIQPGKRDKKTPEPEKKQRIKNLEEMIGKVNEALDGESAKDDKWGLKEIVKNKNGRKDYRWKLMPPEKKTAGAAGGRQK
jgi:hypothetical protein